MLEKVLSVRGRNRLDRQPGAQEQRRPQQGHIRNNGVTTQDLKNSSARGADVRDDSLTGADVLESSLGAVPSAKVPTPRTTPRWPGTPRLRATPPRSAGWARITAGPVRLEGECSDDGGVRSGLIRIVTSTNGTQLSTIIHAGPNEVVLGDSRELAAEDRSIMGQSSSTPAQRMGVFVVNHPASGSYRAGTMFISLNTEGDCAFGITAFG